MRTVIFSHGHPKFSKGGGELAAYHLFNGINALEGHEAWFVARAPEKLLHLGTPVAALNEREFLIAGNAEIPTLTATIALDDTSDFADLLRRIQPDVIHFHHYIFLGMEMIRAARNTCPNAKIVVTLHEYIAICMNSGQMIKTDGRLCYSSSPRECAECFPDRTPEDFFLRERYIKTYFDLVDLFISPSEFLRQRYIDWGIEADRIVMLENGIPDAPAILPRNAGEDEVRGRFAYFGQINPFKGVDLILEAFSKLRKRSRKHFSLDIYGSGLQWQQQAYRDRLGALIEDNKDVIRFHGPYEPSELGTLMTSIDWVVMGSVWWENSPLVIQEAFRFGRPVICPDIGGMAEKVVPNVGGFHYRARESFSLFALLEEIEGMSDDDYLAMLSRLPRHYSLDAAVEAHLAYYGHSRAAVEITA